MIQIKLPIVFSKRTTPEIVDQMIADERIQELLKTEHLLIKMYDYECNASEPLRYFMPDPTKPHGRMCSIEKTDGGYFCNVKIPEPYTEIFNCYEHPVVHPMCTYMEAVTNPRFRIVFFKLYEIVELKKNEIYDGVNYKPLKDHERYPMMRGDVEKITAFMKIINERTWKNPNPLDMMKVFSENPKRYEKPKLKDFYKAGNNKED